MEIGQLLMDRDFTAVYNYAEKLGNNPSRGKLETMSEAIFGGLVPQNNVKFIVYDKDGKCFMIFYDSKNDHFLYEKLTVR